MAGLNFMHHVAQAWERAKLFHIDLNDQAPGRYDQDFRFGSYNLKRLLPGEAAGRQRLRRPRHFDAHAYRTADYEDVKAFARGCIRTYLILKEKAAQFNADLKSRRCWPKSRRRWRLPGQVFADKAAFLGQPLTAKRQGAVMRAHAFDRAALGQRGQPYERLDQA
jgi:xylose isomerase